MIVVCDLDRRNLKTFRDELTVVLDNVAQAPRTSFCLAIEEGEAWLLGDIPAIKKAFPKAKDTILAGYKNDAICGTWEVLADALYPGGSSSLEAQGYYAAGKRKSYWAREISPHMDIDTNRSPSFGNFIATLRRSVAAS